MTATTPAPGTVLLAGATGDLGGRILPRLLDLGATVRVLTRPGTSAALITQLRSRGAEVIQADYQDWGGLRRACTGADCVVSAINGLDSAMIDAQWAGTPRAPNRRRPGHGKEPGIHDVRPDGGALSSPLRGQRRFSYDDESGVQNSHASHRRAVPAVAGHAVLCEHVQRRRKPSLPRQRPLRQPEVDYRAGRPGAAPAARLSPPQPGACEPGAPSAGERG